MLKLALEMKSDMRLNVGNDGAVLLYGVLLILKVGMRKSGVGGCVDNT